MGSEKPTIGCVGAGTLGVAIMERLLHEGFRLLVWNRSAQKLDAIVRAGAIAMPTPSALAASADFVITCVTDGKAVAATVLGEHGIAESGSEQKLLVDMSTMSPDMTVELAAALRTRCGMGWLDAPISGGAPAARAGNMAVMVGGELVDFERANVLWDALAGQATLMGGQGAGQSTKLINQTLAACGFAVLAEACALAERAGVDPAKLPQALAGGRADSRLLQEYMAKMARSEFPVEGRIDIMLKDLHMIASLAHDTGAIMPITALVEQLHRKLVADGHGAGDNSEMVRLYRAKT